MLNRCRHRAVSWGRQLYLCSLLIVLSICACPALLAQQTTVTGTVVDANGNLYSNGTVSTFLVTQAGVKYTFGGQPVNPSTGPFPTDSSGHFTLSLPPNSLITPTDSAWVFKLCAQSVNLGPQAPPTTQICFQTGPIFIITPGPQDVSAQINPFAALLGPHVGSGAPPAGNNGDLQSKFGSNFVATCLNDNGFVIATCRPISLGQAIYNSSTIGISGITPSVAGGNVFVISQGGATTVTNLLGGSDSQSITINCSDTNTTFANNSNLVMVSGAATLCGVNQPLSFVYYAAQSKWLQVGSPSGTGGGGSPQGNNGDVQFKNGALFGASGLNDDGTTVSIARDVRKIKGPNPYIDVTFYGVRAVTGGGPNTTATINSGSSTATLASASTFQNGDGIVIRGAGTNNTLSTPLAPGVVPVNASGMPGTGIDATNTSGATTYQYQIVARTKGGGYTIASPATSIATGPATLGPATVNVSSWTRAANVVTINTASPHNVVSGALVNIQIDPDIAGWYQVNTVPTGSSFTITTAADVRVNARAANAASSGTVTWWISNHITWTAVTNAWQYLIYGRQAGSMALIGVSYPENTNLTSDPLYDVFEDYGSTMTQTPGQPDWVPNTPPVAAKNNDLVSTIVSGAGTTTLVLFDNASNSVVAATARFDDAPTIKAAAVAAATGGAQTGVLYFPSTGSTTANYQTNSFLDLSTGQFPSVLSVMQAGTISLGDTMQLGQTTWRGEPQNPLLLPQFGFQKLPNIASAQASPMIYHDNAQVNFNYITLNATHDSQIIWVDDRGGGIPACRWEYVQFVNNGTDWSGEGLVIRNNISGGGNFYFKNVYFSSGPNISDHDPRPLFINTQGMGPTTFENTFLSRRSLWLGAATTGVQITFNNIYCQGCLMPKITMSNNSGGGNVQVFLEIKNSTEDTTTHPLVTYFGSMTGNIRIHGTNGLGGNDIVTGPGNMAVEFVAAGANALGFGQNVLMEAPLITGTAQDGLLNTNAPAAGSGQKLLSAGLSIGALYQGFVNSAIQVAPTCSVSAGGSVALGSYVFATTPVFAVGSTSGRGEGTLSPPSTTCTTTSGQQTVTINFATVPGAIGYDLYVNGAAFQCVSPWVPGSATGGVWSSGGICGASQPNLSGTGPTNISKTSVNSPAFRSVGATGVGMYTQVPGTLTADRTETKPDVSGTTALTSGGMANPTHTVLTKGDGTLFDSGLPRLSAYDGFNRANGDPITGGPWWTLSAGVAMSIASNKLTAGGAGHSTLVYTGMTFPADDQTVCARHTQVSTSTPHHGLVVRGSATADTNYQFDVYNGNNGAIIKRIAGTPTTLLSSIGPIATNDWVCVNITGTTITVFDNGVQLTSTTDASIASGFPGVHTFNVQADMTWDDWMASNGAVMLNSPQNWNAIQNFVPGIQLNASNTLSSVSGNSGRVAQSSGTLTNNHLANFDANGNIIDSGIAATGANFVLNNTTNTGTAAMTLDMSASTSAGAHRLPNIAGASSTLAGAISFDTTNGHYHGGANAVDNIFGMFPSSTVIANNDCVKATVAAGHITLNTAGGPCGTTTAINDPGSNGIVVRIALNTSVARTLQPSANNNFTWTNPDGVAGNPTPSLIFPSKLWLVGAICNNTVASPAWNLPTSTLPVANCNTGTNIQEGTLDFTDGASAQYTIDLPVDWTGAIDARLIFFDPSTSGTVIWNIQTACRDTTGANNDDVTFNAVDAFTTVNLAAPANAQWETVKTGMNVTGCAAKNTMQVKLSRAVDTAAGAARLKALELTVRRAL